MCCEEITVRLGSLKMVLVDTEMRQSGNRCDLASEFSAQELVNEW